MRTRSETKSIQLVIDALFEEHDVLGAKAMVTEVRGSCTTVPVSLSSEIDCKYRSEIAHTFHGYFKGEISASHTSTTDRRQRRRDHVFLHRRLKR
jgi:hypothetical protein